MVSRNDNSASRRREMYCNMRVIERERERHEVNHEPDEGFLNRNTVQAGGRAMQRPCWYDVRLLRVLVLDLFRLFDLFPSES